MKRIMKILSIEEAKEKIATNLIKEDFFMDALKNKMILINYGSTNYYILKALNINVEYEGYTAGKIKNGAFAVTETEKREKLILLNKGNVKRVMFKEGLSQLGTGDYFIKGGNLLFEDDGVGVFIYSETGGTVGAIGSLIAKGVNIISPISISKRAEYPLIYTKEGNIPGIYFLKNTKIYTEIDSFEYEGYSVRYLGINGLNNNYLVFELIK